MVLLQTENIFFISLNNLTKSTHQIIRLSTCNDTTITFDVLCGYQKFLSELAVVPQYTTLQTFL